MADVLFFVNCIAMFASIDREIALFLAGGAAGIADS